MKIVKRVLLVFVIILAVIQIPFVYRRYKLGRLAENIARLNAERTSGGDLRFKEYKGIIHAHTAIGGHSTGNFDDLVAAANSNNLDFVLMTEHWSDAYDTSSATLNGVYGKTLFVGGNEIDTADGERLLMIPGSAEAASLRKMPTAAVVAKLRSENRLALAAYTENPRSTVADFDGNEVFSLHANARKMNPFTAFFDLIWSFPAYPELTYASYFRRPDANLQQYDEITARRNAALFTGADAHSNIGFHFFSDDAGNKLINIKLDSYRTIFALARQHVLIVKNVPLTRDSVVEAIRQGRFFTGFDVLGDTSGFSFTAANGGTTMGDAIPEAANLTFQVVAPVAARIVVFKNGEVFREKDGSSELAFAADGPGAYRVEVYLNRLGPPYDKMPWIMSNPIYVR